jgi:hypothetical protein
MADKAGQGGNWQAIAAANGIENPRALVAGQLVNLRAGGTGGIGIGIGSVSAGAGVGAGAGPTGSAATVEVRGPRPVSAQAGTGL